MLKLDKLNKLKKQNYENIAKLYLIIIDKKAGLKIKVSLMDLGRTKQAAEDDSKVLDVG